MSHFRLNAVAFSAFLYGALASAQPAIQHQITLGPGQRWCEDAKIYGLFNNINTLRVQRGVAQLKLDPLGMKDAELRAVQFAAYMATHSPDSPGFAPHEGWDTTAASIGYNVITENLAYITQDPAWIVYNVWQDRLHLDAMLTTQANVAGVSCIYSDDTAYWTYEPGNCPGGTCNSAPPAGPALDSEQWTFLALINAFRAQNGVGPLRVSATLQTASQWMSTDMATKNYASHTDSLGRSAGARLAAFGYTYSPWGENIAAGYSGAQEVLEGWKTACDPDPRGNCTYAHRVNMLTPGFAAIGIGRAFGAGSRYGWYWITDFGGYVDQPIDPNPGPQAPAIQSFTASPTTVSVGQAALLSWSVTGATSLSIDQGVGSVTGRTSVDVRPSGTTTYRLTASNAVGTSTASVLVTVNTTGGDTQPPTAPVITRATAPNPQRVDLEWTASADNVAVAGYQVLRNTTSVATLTAGVRSFSDLTVSSGVTYTYMVKAVDAAGNVASSAPVQVTTPGVPSSTGCPAPATNAFTGCYYSNTTLAGNPVLTRVDPVINFDWGAAAPHPSLTPFDFSVRWQGSFDFAQGPYTLTASASDGMRIYIDDILILDRWRDQSTYTYTLRRTLSAGKHLIVVEYYERSGTAVAKLSWRKDSIAQPPDITAFSASPSTLVAGQSGLLSWNVTDANSVAIDNNVGSVPPSGSRSISPATTTTYRLTATNQAGTSTATVTVTVGNPSGDSQPPSTPVIRFATARNATTVDLSWLASHDNVSVAGYQLIRNGSLLANTGGTATTWVDTTARAGTSYVYTLKAFDTAGNYSAASAEAKVTTPQAPGPGGCSPGAVGTFTACYYDNPDLAGNSVLTTLDNQVSFNWQTGFPNPVVSASGFSVRWQGTFHFEAGVHTFKLLTSDGARLYIDGELVVDRWRDQPPFIYTARRTLTTGNHLIVLEYYGRTGSPIVQLTW